MSGLDSSKLLIDWRRRPGATEEEVAALEAQIGHRLPATYRALLHWSNGGYALGDEGDFELWATHEVLTKNALWRITDHFPGTFAFGSDYDDYRYLFDFRRPVPADEVPVLVVDSGSPYWEDAAVAAWTVDEFLRLERAPGPYDTGDDLGWRGGAHLQLVPVADVPPSGRQPGQLARLLRHPPLDAVSTPPCALFFRLELETGRLTADDRSRLPAPFTAQLATLLATLTPDGWAVVATAERAREGAAPTIQQSTGAEVLVTEVRRERLCTFLRRQWPTGRAGELAPLQVALLPRPWLPRLRAWATTPPERALAELLRTARAGITVWSEGDGLSVFSDQMSPAEVEAAIAVANQMPNMW